MRTEKIQVFKFSDLSEEAQQKVLKRLREINVNYDFWDFLEYDLREDLKKIGVEYDKVYFDIEPRYKHIYLDKPRITSQDLFKNSIFSDNEKVINELKKEPSQEDLSYFSIETSCNGEHNFVVLEDYKGEAEEEIKEQYTEALNNILNKFLKAVEEAYNYGLSDEAIKDTIEANEMEFLKDGRSF